MTGRSCVRSPEPAPFPVVDVPLRGPEPAEIGDDLDAVRAWIAALEAGSRRGSHYTLRYAPVGGRLIGRNELPSRAVIESYEQAAALLGVGRPGAGVPGRAVGRRHGASRLGLGRGQSTAGAGGRGHRGRRCCRRTVWLEHARGSGRYLREITAPGVDTKFVERHRPLLAQLLRVPAAAAGFLAALGLRAQAGDACGCGWSRR